MSEQPAAPPFSPDRPISSSAEDRLNRRDFAFALGDSIRLWSGADSLVIGLNGEWGSGKTSIINLIREHLGANPPAPDIILFSPWEWSGHEELATAFFRELEIHLNLRQTPSGSRVAERFEHYARLLNAGATVADSIAPIATAVSVLLLIAGGATIVLDKLLSAGFVLGLGALGLIASRLGGVMQALSAAFRRPPQPARSLAQVKAELAAALNEYDRAIFVVVDDVDRLTPPDAVRMLQLVKANADLPKMVYLLAYDVTGLSRSVEATLNVPGSDYVEKIVQVPIQVPKADKSALEALLFTEVDKVLEPEPVQRRFVADRWRSLFLDGVYTPGIHSYFSTPRRIFRFVSALQFDLMRLVDQGECNVDPVDFIGIEALRVFDPAVYDGVAAEKNFLTGAAGGDNRQQQRDQEAVNRILEQTPAGLNRTLAEHILRELFPAVEWALTGTQQIFDRQRQLGERRVCHSDMFDFYFQMAVPSESLSEGEVQQVVTTASTGREALTEALRGLIGRSRIRPFLRDLAARIERIPPGQERVFISSLFDIGDELEAQVERMLDISDTLRAEFIIQHLLERVPANDRLPLLDQAASDSLGVALPLSFIRLEMHRGDRNNRPAIDDEEGLRRLGESLVERIRSLAAAERLLDHRHLAEVMFAWSFFGKTQDVKNWAEDQATTPEGLLRLFQAFVGYGAPNNVHPLSEYIDLEAAITRTEAWLASDHLAPGTADGLHAAMTAVREFYNR